MQTKLVVSPIEAKILVILHLIPDDVDVGNPRTTAMLKTSLKAMLEHSHTEAESKLSTINSLLGSIVANHEEFFRLRRDLYEMIESVMFTDFPSISCETKPTTE